MRVHWNAGYCLLCSSRKLACEIVFLSAYSSQNHTSRKLNSPEPQGNNTSRQRSTFTPTLSQIPTIDDGALAQFLGETEIFARIRPTRTAYQASREIETTVYSIQLQHPTPDHC